MTFDAALANVLLRLPQDYDAQIKICDMGQAGIFKTSGLTWGGGGSSMRVPLVGPFWGGSFNKKQQTHKAWGYRDPVLGSESGGRLSQPEIFKPGSRSKATIGHEGMFKTAVPLKLGRLC